MRTITEFIKVQLTRDGYKDGSKISNIDTGESFVIKGSLVSEEYSYANKKEEGCDICCFSDKGDKVLIGSFDLRNNNVIRFPWFVCEEVKSDNVEELSQFNPQPHYDNSNGSLYHIAENRKWNSYQFDIVKRIDRALKKGKFEEDLQKTKDLIDLWLLETKKGSN